MESFARMSRRDFLFAAVSVAFATLPLVGCGNDSKKKEEARVEKYVGTWKPTELKLGGEPLDVSGDVFTIELYQDMTGKLTTASGTQDTSWELRGSDADNAILSERVVVKVDSDYELGGMTIHLLGTVLHPTDAKDSVTFEETAKTTANGIDARVTLSGTLEKTS